MNYKNLNQKIDVASNELMLLKSKLANLPGSFYIEAAFNKADIFTTDSEVTVLLANELCDRDYPMTYEDLKEVFEASGLPYHDGHIQSCRPDSHECKREIAAEERE